MMLLDRTTQPRVGDIEYLAVQMPQRFIMSNDVPLNILSPGDNKVIRIDLLMEGGHWHQSQPLQALFTNRMLHEGTLQCSALEIAKKLDYYGTWLKLSSASEYAYITLCSLNKYLPRTLDILESIVEESTFPEKELGVIAENNIRRFTANSSKVDFSTHRALMKAMCGGQHPYGQLVQKEDYKRITPDVLHKFYDRHYHFRNCTICVSGKIGDGCVQQIEDLFGREAFGKGFQKPGKTNFIPVSSVDERIFVKYADVMQNAVRMGMPSLKRCHPDYLKARVMMTLFGEYLGSRLMSDTREEKGYTYGISADIAPYPGQGMLVINMETVNKFIKPLVRGIHHGVDRLQNDPVPKDELFMIKNYMLGEMCRSYESAFSLAGAWMFVQVLGFGNTRFEDASSTIENITPEEVRELAGRYLCKEKLKEVISGEEMS